MTGSASISASTGLHVVIGAGGQLGRELVTQLHALGHRVRAVTRTRSIQVPAGVEARTGDIVDPADAERLCRGATVIYACFGAPHQQWPEVFPAMARGVLWAATRSSARLVFADNLYAYGPQTQPLVETLASTVHGRKPRLRAEIAERLLAAHRAGMAELVIARASDFYGPGIDNAMIGTGLVRALLDGRRIFLPGDLDAPHTFTFVPDFARALIVLGAAAGVSGQVWHVPSAPAIGLRALVERLAALAGTRARVHALPRAATRIAGWFSPATRELLELGFQWDRPYLVSHAKYAARFGDRFTPLDLGLAATLASVRTREADVQHCNEPMDSAIVAHEASASRASVHGRG